jgi:hypothetical protein
VGGKEKSRVQIEFAVSAGVIQQAGIAASENSRKWKDI